MKIGIAGAGGIGSNVADNLVRSGIDDLKIVDFDRVEAANLDRQNYYLDQVGLLKVDALKENLTRINPSIKIEPVEEKIEEENIENIFQDCEIVVEAFDEEKYKKLLFERLANKKRFCIGASGIAGREIDKIKTRSLDNCVIVGDFQTDIAEEKVYASKLRIITGMMSNIIIKKSGLYE
ncbi:MAG TPA: sulfur carrier protein ThiS adenylyltransferase ThiF [bacterium]|nr:sulfur carrier protein ThiS adenylyltransferase ThiF [bacterium]